MKESVRWKKIASAQASFKLFFACLRDIVYFSMIFFLLLCSFLVFFFTIKSQLLIVGPGNRNFDRCCSSYVPVFITTMIIIIKCQLTALKKTHLITIRWLPEAYNIDIQYWVATSVFFSFFFSLLFAEFPFSSIALPFFYSTWTSRKSDIFQVFNGTKIRRRAFVFSTCVVTPSLTNKCVRKKKMKKVDDSCE